MWLTRYRMYEAIAEALAGQLSGRILGISGIEHFLPMIDLGDSDLVEVSYPEVSIEELPFPDESFDCIISDQVLEHITAPWKAFLETARVLRTGGTAVHTTCFMNAVHPAPGDFYRFTPTGLEALCPPSLDVVSAGGWGNRIALTLICWHDGFRRIEIPEKRSIRRWLATKNHDNFPIATWIVLTKHS